MRNQKGSRKIIIGDVEYRWRATGNDGYIAVGIWPARDVGPFIVGNVRYHENASSAGNPIIVTSRIIRRIIEHATAVHGYNPQVRGKELRLRHLDDVIKLDDAIRRG